MHLTINRIQFAETSDAQWQGVEKINWVEGEKEAIDETNEQEGDD